MIVLFIFIVNSLIVLKLFGWMFYLIVGVRSSWLVCCWLFDLFVCIWLWLSHPIWLLFCSVVGLLVCLLLWVFNSVVIICC